MNNTIPRRAYRYKLVTQGNERFGSSVPFTYIKAATDKEAFQEIYKELSGAPFHCLVLVALECERLERCHNEDIWVDVLELVLRDEKAPIVLSKLAPLEHQIKFEAGGFMWSLSKKGKKKPKKKYKLTEWLRQDNKDQEEEALGHLQNKFTVAEPSQIKLSKFNLKVLTQNYEENI